MLKSYQAHIDASAKGDPRLLVLAGYIAPAKIWEDFSRVWQARLDDASISHFKMNEWANRPEIAGYFYRVLEETNIPIALSCIVRTDEMVKVIRSINWPFQLYEDREFENPYYFAFKAISNSIIQHQQNLGIDEPIALIFDDDGEKSKTIEAWDLLKLACPPQIRHLLGDPPSYKNDKTVLPLQAADLLAWWIRKWELDSVDTSVPELPFPWKMQKDIPRLHMEFRERQFREEFATMLEPENMAQALRNAQAVNNPKSRRRRSWSGIRMTIPDPSSRWNWRS